MGPRQVTGRLLVIILLLIAISYLPPPEEKDWLSKQGLPVLRALPSTLHVTHVKALLFRGMALVLGGILLVRVAREKRTLGPTAEEILLLSVLMLYALSSLWTDWPRGWFVQTARVSFAVLWAVVVARLVVRERCEGTAMRGIVAAGAATALLGLIAFLAMWACNPGLVIDSTFRLAVPHKSNSNFTACILITPLLMAWYAGVGGGARKVLWGLLGVLMAVALVLTRSASGCVGVAVGAIALAALNARAAWRRRIIAIPAGLLVVAGIVMVSIPGLMEQAVHFCLQGTRALRYFFWQDAFRMILQRPFLGWGGGGFFYAYPQFRQPEEFLYPQVRKIIGDHAHNELLNMGVELGLVGALVACGFVILLVRRAAGGMGERADRRWERALLAGTLGMMAQSCFSPSLRSWDVAPFFWTQIGLLMALARTRGGRELSWVECGAACRAACVALLVAAVAGGAIVSYRDWQGEVLLAQGMVFDVRNREEADAAAPYLKRGASLVMDPVWWYNAKFRYAVCLRTQGQLNEAIRVLEEIDHEVPNLGATRLYLGELYFARFLKGRVVADHAAALSNLNGYLSANADAGGCLLAARVLLAGKPHREIVVHYLERCLVLGPSEAQRAEAERLLKEVR